jgi:hypothetical protein
MKKSLLIKNCQTYNSNCRKVKKSRNFCGIFSPKNSFKCLFLMVSISSLAYLFQINQLASMGQELNKKESKLEELKEESRDLEIKVAQSKASYHFDSERERLKMVNPDQVSFVEIKRDNPVAMID